MVLLHALGLSRHSWDPVVPALATHFDVHAIDLPGFGDAARLPADIDPSPVALARAVAAQLDAAGIRAPHVVGNSIGGWVALELARIRPVASLTLLAPAGMWPAATPRYCRYSLRTTRWLTRHGAPILDRLVRYRVGRLLVLGQSHGRPARISVAQARAAIRCMGTAPGFDATLAATINNRYVPDGALEVPTTVAYGTRDRILPRRSWRDADRLPAGTVIATLPRCGHIPMYDDPAAVAHLIMTSARRGSPASSDSQPVA
jgi:pimeloyl-ACP methyl ester carboxylesterase